MNRWNDWLANKLGNSLSSMYFFYFCIVLDLVELDPIIKLHSVVAWCAYLSQSVIQLIALPVLGAQNKLQQKSHNDTMKAVNNLHDKVDKNHEEHMQHIMKIHLSLGQRGK